LARRIPILSLAAVLAASVATGQERPSDPGQPAESKRILGIIPNYRTSSLGSTYEPLSVREKFKVASEDSFDPGTFALAGVFGGEAQLTNGNRSFGQGVKGFGRYYGSAYGDLVIGDFMTEAVFPTLLHQDPRYFRRGTGSTFSRLGYAMGQIFWTHSERGVKQFNYSEVIGSSSAVAISNAYYRDNRTVSDAVSRLGMQLGVDMAADILKEFWPEVRRHFRHTQRKAADPKT